MRLVMHPARERCFRTKSILGGKMGILTDFTECPDSSKDKYEIRPYSKGRWCIVRGDGIYDVDFVYATRKEAIIDAKHLLSPCLSVDKEGRISSEAVTELTDLDVGFMSECGEPIIDAVIEIEECGGDLVDLYYDRDLTISIPNPIIPDSSGMFPNIYFKCPLYNLIIKKDDGAIISIERGIYG